MGELFPDTRELSLLFNWISHVLRAWSEIIGFAWLLRSGTPKLGYPYNISKGGAHEQI